MANATETEIRADSATREHETAPEPAEIHVEPERKPEDLLVPLVDEHEAGRIYDPALLRWALWGALLGSFLLGWLGAAVANGDVPIAGFGQWAVSGPMLAAVTGGGIGLALGGLIGALLALGRMPSRHPQEHHEHRDRRPAAHVPERNVAEPAPEHRE